MVGARKDGGWEGGRKRRVGGREGGRGGRGGRGGEGRGGMGRAGMREGGGGGDGGRQGGRQGGREAGMMLCRERASVVEERVEGGRVDEGNERGRDGTGYGRPRERGEGGSKRRMD